MQTLHGWMDRVEHEIIIPMHQQTQRFLFNFNDYASLLMHFLRPLHTGIDGPRSTPPMMTVAITV